MTERSRSDAPVSADVFFQIVCLRLSRVNHACISNASHFSSGDLKVKILFSEKAIKAGEEITVSYMSHRQVQHFNLPELIKGSLMLHWDIVCPAGTLKLLSLLTRLDLPSASAENFFEAKPGLHFPLK